MNAVFLMWLAVIVAQTPTRDQNSPADANRPAELRGTIVDESGHGVPGAVIVLHGGPAPAVFTTITDTSGAFRFDELPPDSYTLRAMKSGYPRIEYGQTQPLEPGTPIVLRPGASATISVPMPPGAVITGVVRDEHGKPLQGQVLLVTRPDGGQFPPGLMPSPVTTDASGRFRIFGLPSGTYAVKARRTSGYSRGSEPLSKEVQVTVSTAGKRDGIELRMPPLTVSEQR